MQSTPSRRMPLWLLVIVTIVGTLAMHMFLPALPDAGLALSASSGQMQLTITIYILGLGLGQLIYGPLSDSLGRRPMLLTGLGLFSLASLAAAAAPSASWLIGARLFQALGGCAGLALGRAIARDTATPETAVSSLALLNLMMMLGPGIAPALGSAIDQAWGWRGIFACLAVAGSITAASVYKLLPETGRPTGRLDWRLVRDDYRRLLSSRTFVGFAIGGGCATTSVYAFLAAAPFIFIDQLHTSKHEVAIYLGILMAGMAAGNALARQMVRSIALDRLMLGGNLLSLVGAMAFLIAALLHQLTPYLVVGLMLMFALGAGLASPTALSRALSVQPDLTGSAAGVYGCTQMAVGGLCTLGASFGSDPALSAALVLALACTLGQLSFRAALRASVHPGVSH
ncbi:multidrug effflux MFS transporter [Comamonas composti]|uniref:multidrug effflux MFS transporter n=1 Tax=Comamonas composti TaxID=408558 RepID=UPI00047C23D9|nr:multidrug effflux MFS transporter [Comamonas composti]